MKQVIQLDADGYFVGTTMADESPLESGLLLMPAMQKRKKALRQAQLLKERRVKTFSEISSPLAM